MNKPSGLKPLGRVWLDELGLLHKLDTEATAVERAMLIGRANAAAEAVERQFKAMTAAGQLRHLSVAYRSYVRSTKAKAKGKPPRPWWSFALSERHRLIRAMAREQVHQAREGRRLDPVPPPPQA